MTRLNTNRWIWLAGALTALGALVIGVSLAGAEEAVERSIMPRKTPHVAELARYLKQLQVGKPLVHGELAVFPVTQRGAASLRGQWLTMDAAIKSGVLIVTEQGEDGTVPLIHVKNLSRDQHVLITSGEVVAGGKQTRTVQRDIVLAPGQKADADVFCVEAQRWEGEAVFYSAEVIVPQSIQKQVRRGTSQQAVWADVARTNAALGSQNETASLAVGLESKAVKARLARVSRSIVPKMPRQSVGFIFVHRGRAVGAEFFGRSDLAAALLPKLVDAYAVDFVLQQKQVKKSIAPPDRRIAAAFLRRIERAGSTRSDTPGSGAGIRTSNVSLVGAGVSLADQLVHFGVQEEQRLVPQPRIDPIPERRR
jgi:hypothetical protein